MSERESLFPLLREKAGDGSTDFIVEVRQSDLMTLLKGAKDDVQLEPLSARDRFLLLRIEADACRRSECELEQRRELRDRLALALVDEGYSWRDVASVAGFKNPYIATLKKRRGE